MSEPVSDDTIRPCAKVLTVSDGVVRGTRDDLSGRALVEHLSANGFDVVEHRVTADGADPVAAILIEMADGFAGVIVSTGGTGFAPWDQTPEGTSAVIERGGARACRGDAAVQSAGAAVAAAWLASGARPSLSTRRAVPRAASNNSTR